MNRALALTFFLTFTSSGCTTAVPERHSPQDPTQFSLNWIEHAGNWPHAEEYRVELVTFHDKLNDDVHLIRYDVSITGRKLLLVAQTTFGVPLYETSLADGKLIVTPFAAQMLDLPIERGIADFLLATWPIDQLKSALLREGYTIQERGLDRLVWNHQERLLMQILLSNFESERLVRIVHHDIPLEISIQTIEKNSTSP